MNRHDERIWRECAKKGQLKTNSMPEPKKRLNMSWTLWIIPAMFALIALHYILKG